MYEYGLSPISLLYVNEIGKDHSTVDLVKRMVMSMIIIQSTTRMNPMILSQGFMHKRLESIRVQLWGVWSSQVD